MTTKTVQNIGQTETIVYQCPNAKTSTLSRVSISNTSDSEITFDIAYYNSSEDNTVYLIKNGHLDTGQTHGSISSSNTMDIAANDYISIISTIDSSIDASITYAEADV